MAILSADAPEFVAYGVPISPHNYQPLSVYNHYSPYSHPITYSYCPPCCLSSSIVTLTYSPCPPSLTLDYDPFYMEPQWPFNLLPLQPVSPMLVYNYADQNTEVLTGVVVPENIVTEEVRNFRDSYFCGKERLCRQGYEVQDHRSMKKNKKNWKLKVVVKNNGETPSSGKIIVKNELAKSVESGAIERYVLQNIDDLVYCFISRGMLLEFLDRHCWEENQKCSSEVNNSPSAYDFVYLPIDFGSKGNKGYAFVNFTTPSAVWRLYISIHNFKWGVLNSKKICEISYARIQGKEALIKHFQGSAFTCVTDDYLPVCFEKFRDGSSEWVKQITVGKRMEPLGATSSESNHDANSSDHLPGSPW
ncbi:hypothetical protein IFM89_037315 [Coptis chinensis]|uniref:Mei2-like C-terminal RNA recognition motif domain-containing protein n=1 Tax=Coptis chinensis TaxID=261450 RepID=A0A835LY22_9MAGN|nr:hypothetical protein IFM89_037315 [Coptis chinensis]